MSSNVQPPGNLPCLILLGADSPIGLSIIRELGSHGVAVHCIGSSPRSIGLYSRFAASSHLRSRGEAALLDQIRRLAAQTGARFLMTVGEGDILMLQRNRGQLDEVTPIIPDPEPFSRVLDKGLTYDTARRLGIRVPQCWTPSSPGDLAALREELRFPVVLKWANPHRVSKHLARSGVGLAKYQYVYDYGELLEYVKQFEDIGELPLLQEYCPGYGLGQMLLMHDGEAILRFQHKREAEWPPEGGVSAVCRSLPPHRHAELMDKSIALLRELRWSGPAMVEYRYDPSDGTAWLMEINGRFWGSQPLAYYAGAHFAWLWYQSAISSRIPPVPEYRVGLRCRYFAPEVKRLIRILIAPGKIQDRGLRFSRIRELGRFLASYLDPRTRYYVFSLRDPKPFLQDLLFALRLKREPR